MQLGRGAHPHSCGYPSVKGKREGSGPGTTVPWGVDRRGGSGSGLGVGTRDVVPGTWVPDSWGVDSRGGSGSGLGVGMKDVVSGTLGPDPWGVDSRGGSGDGLGVGTRDVVSGTWGPGCGDFCLHGVLGSL